MGPDSAASATDGWEDGRNEGTELAIFVGLGVGSADGLAKRKTKKKMLGSTERYDVVFIYL